MLDPSARSDGPDVMAFHDQATATLQYVVSDPTTGHCAIIDPVLDFDAKSGTTATHSASRLLAFVAERGLTVRWILDTHPHADHLSAAFHIHCATGAPMAIGERITGVQKLWKQLYNLPAGFPTDGSQWHRTFADGERFAIGRTEVAVLLTPGHTLCSVTYVAGNAAFINDTLFSPDSGTARADFPGGDAAQLWQGIKRILALPPGTRLFTGHDYQPGGRPVACESTIADQLARNAHLVGHDETSFIALRTRRDSTLPIPRMMLAALQVNIAGGRLPEPESDGRSYLKIPLNAFTGATWD